MAALYKLAPDVFDRVYETILDTYARNKASLRFPRLAIVGGQPGAGKSTVTGLISEGFGTKKEPVVVDFDAIRDFNPTAKEVFQRHPFEMAVYTNEDTWAWTDRFLEDIRRAKNNALYETTLRVANPIELIIQSFQDVGYSVDLHALAVNSKLSVQGIYERFEYQLGFKEAPRWTGIEFHDAVYGAFPVNVGHLEATANLERVSVYQRNGASVYLNTQTAMQATGAEQAITAERNREWELETKQEFLGKWAKISAAIESRDASAVKPDWYVENARRLFIEAELFAVSRSALPAERIVLSRIEAVTHHHVFMRGKATSELVCFDINALDVAKVPTQNLRLVPQPQDSQP